MKGISTDPRFARYRDAFNELVIECNELLQHDKDARVTFITKKPRHATIGKPMLFMFGEWEVTGVTGDVIGFDTDGRMVVTYSAQKVLDGVTRLVYGASVTVEKPAIYVYEGRIGYYVTDTEREERVLFGEDINVYGRHNIDEWIVTALYEDGAHSEDVPRYTTELGKRVRITVEVLGDD